MSEVQISPTSPVGSATPYLVQDVVPLFAGSNLNEFAQEERSTLGDGRELRDILILAFKTANLQNKQTNMLRPSCLILANTASSFSAVHASTHLKPRHKMPYHHLLQDGVGPQQVVFARVLLHVLLGPHSLS